MSEIEEMGWEAALRLARQDVAHDIEHLEAEIWRLMRDALAEAGAYRREFARAEAAEAERDALRAQVAAVRALAENARKHAGGSYTAQVDALSIERALSSSEPVTAGPGDIADMARRFSLWLNSTYPPDLDTEALHWRRVSKVSEEAGEVREALGAWFSENPRKPAGTVEDVIKELADCVGAALGAIEHLTGHEGRSLDIAAERVRFVCERVGVLPAGEVTPPAEQRDESVAFVSCRLCGGDGEFGEGDCPRCRQSCHRCRAAWIAEWDPLDWPAPPPAQARAPWYLRWLGSAR